MIIGSLIWGAGVGMVWIVLLTALFLVLNLWDWTSGKNLKTAERLTEKVTFDDEYPSQLVEAIATFRHNFRAAIIIYVLAASLAILLPGSIVTMAVPPLLAAMYTAVNVGAIAFVAVTIHQARSGGFGVFLAVALPHGVVELPAIWLIMGHSLRIAITSDFNLWGSLAIVGVWVVLLFAAAFVESYVTPKVADWALAKWKDNGSEKQ